MELLIYYNMNSIWAGGQSENIKGLKESWAHERKELLFRLKHAETKEEKLQVKSKLKELDEQYSLKISQSNYSNYMM
jgi:hypothetical protein